MFSGDCSSPARWPDRPARGRHGGHDGQPGPGLPAAAGRTDVLPGHGPATTVGAAPATSSWPDCGAARDPAPTGRPGPVTGL